MLLFFFQAAQIPAKKSQSEADVSVCSEVRSSSFSALILCIALAHTENYLSCNH